MFTLSPSHILAVLLAVSTTAMAVGEQADHKVGPSKYPLDKSKRNLLEASQILANGTTWTIVPKTSILTVPERLQNKLVQSPKGKFVDWRTFLNSNPAWLDTEKVNLTTASGRAKIDYEHFATISRRGKITIAIHKGNPVSMSPKGIEKTPPTASK